MAISASNSAERNLSDKAERVSTGLESYIFHSKKSRSITGYIENIMPFEVINARRSLTELVMDLNMYIDLELVLTVGSQPAEIYLPPELQNVGYLKRSPIQEHNLQPGEKLKLSHLHFSQTTVMQIGEMYYGDKDKMHYLALDGIGKVLADPTSTSKLSIERIT